MKKTAFVLLLTCIAFAAGFILGDRSWERKWFGDPLVIVPQVPGDVIHFGIAQIPAFSSDHYYFQCGFTDVDEYWSFCLPPELAENFLAAYVGDTDLPLAEDTDDIPSTVLGAAGWDEWDNRYWFSSLEELDRVYCTKHLFCGYSANRNRLYLMNWND